MRILNALAGLSVLFTTFAFAHLLHHYYTSAGDTANSPPFLAGMAFGVIILILSFVGGCLLLRSARTRL
jgi:hypothetical protein